MHSQRDIDYARINRKIYDLTKVLLTMLPEHDETTDGVTTFCPVCTALSDLQMITSKYPLASTIPPDEDDTW
jgi:hypothetical protein